MLRNAPLNQQFLAQRFVILGHFVYRKETHLHDPFQEVGNVSSPGYK